MTEWDEPKELKGLLPDEYWWSDEWVDGHYWRYYWDHAGKFIAKKHLRYCPYDILGA